MDIRKTLFLVLIGIIVYYFLNTATEPFAVINEKSEPKTKKSNISKKKDEDEILEDIANDIRKWQINNNSQKSEVLKGFVDSQYHPHYQDFLNAVELIIPHGRQIFNPVNLPTKYSKPDVSEVEPLMQEFVKLINLTVRDKVVMPKENKNGWEDFQKSLGLSVLHEDKKFQKGVYSLLHINKVEKAETEAEEKFVVEAVISKDISNDQSVIKVHLVRYKNEQVDENNFFNPGKEDKNPVRVEHVYVIGFLTEKENAMTQPYSPDMNLCHFDDLNKQKMMSTHDIHNILRDKYMEKQKEMEARTAMLDEDGRVFDLHLSDKKAFIPSYNNFLNHGSVLNVGVDRIE